MNSDRRMPTEAEDAADKAVRKVFAILGVNVDEPSEVEEFREDLRFGKTLRKLANKGMLAMVAVFIGGMVALLWAGLIAKVKGGA